MAIASFTSAFADTEITSLGKLKAGDTIKIYPYAKIKQSSYVLDGVTYALEDWHSEARAMKADTKLSGNITIPQYIELDSKKFTVTSVDINCFCGCSSLTSISLPNSVTSLGAFCFYF